MTVKELIDAIESKGYQVVGDRRVIPMNSIVVKAPMVLIPRMPAVREECDMVDDITEHLYKVQPGLARIDGSATVTRGPFHVVNLVFCPAESDTMNQQVVEKRKMRATQ